MLGEIGLGLWFGKCARISPNVLSMTSLLRVRCAEWLGRSSTGFMLDLLGGYLLLVCGKYRSLGESRSTDLRIKVLRTTRRLKLYFLPSFLYRHTTHLRRAGSHGSVLMVLSTHILSKFRHIQCGTTIFTTNRTRKSPPAAHQTFLSALSGYRPSPISTKPQTVYSNPVPEATIFRRPSRGDRCLSVGIRPGRGSPS